MNRDVVIGRLEMLVALIDKAGTGLDPSSGVDLFNEHLIRTTEKINYIRELIKGEEDLDTDADRVFMISTMRSANRLWKVHHKVIAGDFDTIEALEMEERVMEYLDDGSKINAIKYYREWMNEYTDKGISLREAKDTIDAYAARREVSLI